MIILILLFMMFVATFLSLLIFGSLLQTYAYKVCYLSITGKIRSDIVYVTATSSSGAYKKARKLAELGCAGWECIERINIMY